MSKILVASRIGTFSHKQLSLTSGLHVRRIEKTPPDNAVNITENKHFNRLNTKPSISCGRIEKKLVYHFFYSFQFPNDDIGIKGEATKEAFVFFFYLIFSPIYCTFCDIFFRMNKKKRLMNIPSHL